MPKITINWDDDLKIDYVETYFNSYNKEHTIFAIVDDFEVVGFDSGPTVHRSEYTKQLDDDGYANLPVYDMQNEDVGLGDFEDCPEDTPLDVKLDCFEDFRWFEIIDEAIDQFNDYLERLEEEEDDDDDDDNDDQDPKLYRICGR